MRTIITLAVLFLLPSVAMAELGLNQQVTFTVPQLSGPILAWAFNDIDHDGTPDILACDSSTLVAYSYPLDSVIMTAAIPPGWYQRRLVLDDVNRDSIADVVLAGEFSLGDTVAYRVRLYDGASGFSAMTQEEYVAVFSWTGMYSPGVAALQATDINNDGYNEMLLSFDSVRWDGVYWFDDRTAGTSYLYYSFPDSIQWHRNQLTSAFLPWPPSNDTALFLCHSYSIRYNELGDDYTYTIVTPHVVRSDGSTLTLFDMPSMGNCSSWMYLENRSHRVTFGCRGDIDPNSPGEDMVLSFDWSLSCDYAVQRGAYLEARRLGPIDSVQVLWQREVDFGRYNSFEYYPDHPGIFFAVDAYQACVTEFYGADGSVRQTSASFLPADAYDWTTAYPDSLPRLMVINGASVSIYSLDEATGVDDGTDTPLPTSFTLADPYPNPFNPTTTLSLSLPRAGILTVEVFNLLGRRVAVLHEGRAAAGNIDLTWDGSQQSSGVYFIRAQFDNAARTVKAMLLK